MSYPLSAFVFAALILYALYLRRVRRAQSAAPSRLIGPPVPPGFGGSANG